MSPLLRRACGCHATHCSVGGMTPEMGADRAAGRPAYSLYCMLAGFPVVAVFAAITGQYLHLALSLAMTVLTYLAIRIVDRAKSVRIWDAAIKFSKARLIADNDQVEQLFAQLPPRYSGAGYLYAVQFDTGAIKVGQTEVPRVRLRQHRRDADAYGVSVVTFWLSPPHSEFIRNEVLLLAACGMVGGRRKNEYFRGIGLDRVIRLAASLPMTPIGELVP